MPEPTNGRVRRKRPPKWVTVDAVASELGISTSRVRQFIRAGHLKSHRGMPRHYTDDRPRVGAGWHRIYLDDLDNFVAKWAGGLIRGGLPDTVAQTVRKTRLKR